MTTIEKRVHTERKAFDAMLKRLLKDHAGEVVVFRDGKPVQYFDDYGDAYDFSLGQFGENSGTLITRVEERIPQPVSFAFEAGILFG